MFTRSSLIRVCGAFVALALTAVTLSAVTLTGREHLTFSGRVTLPGVTLEAGTLHIRGGRLDEHPRSHSCS